MKKLLAIIVLIFFTTNVIAEEILMKCKYSFYTYVSNSGDITIYTANIKEREKKKSKKYCPSSVNEENSDKFISLEGITYDVENYKAICTASKVVYTNGNVGSGVEFLDFKNQTYGYEAIINGKELSSRENCKIKSRKQS
jgi:hypothetical protein